MPYSLQICTKYKKTFLIIGIIICSTPYSLAQISGGIITGASLNTLQTAVPFLTIAPDARAGAMGDVGVASVPDVNSQHWNLSKYPFTKARAGLGISYSPWLKNLIPDIHLLYLAGYLKLLDRNVISGSVRYFSLGTVRFTGITTPANYYQYEIAVDAGYSLRLSEKFSGGLALRYIHSDLSGGRAIVSGVDRYPGNAVAGDFGLYYQDESGSESPGFQWAFGVLLSNLGTKISYADDDPGSRIPTNLRVGGRFSSEVRENHNLSLNLDFNKLLVPTPPVYGEDSATGDMRVLAGKEIPESIMAGVFQSFWDAPGIHKEDGSRSVLDEEIHEITIGIGLEYSYMSRYSARTGYFHEHSSKGNRKYFTLGVGARFRPFDLCISYLKPTNGQNSPLANTFRFTIQTAISKI